MFSKVTLASLFVAVAFAAPPPYMSDGPTPSIIQLKSNVSCTNSPSVAPTPSPSIILLNGPSPPEPSASNPSDGYAAAPQPSGTPPVINLNAPGAPPPSVIKLNRRQFSSTSATSTFSFGGIVPSSSIPPLSPVTPTTSSSSSSFSSSSIPTSPPASAPTELPNGISAFTSTGADGVKTVLLLSTVTVTDSACTSSPVLNPSSTFSFSLVLSPPAPTVSLSAADSPSSVPAAVAQAPPVTNSVSSPGIITLTAAGPPTTPPVGIAFGSVPSPSITPAPSPAQASPSGTCDFGCQLTLSV